MTPTADFGKAVSRASAVVILILGIALLFTEMLMHYLSGDSVWSLVPIVIAAVCIGFAMLQLSPTETKDSLHELAALIPILGPMLTSRIPGGRRVTDPADPQPEGEHEAIKKVIETAAKRTGGE